MDYGRSKRFPENARHLGPWEIAPPTRLRCIAQVISLGVLALTTIVGPTHAQVSTGDKLAWKWSVEERLSARFSPASMEARHKNRKLASAALQEYPASEETVDIINGRETPELFLNWELFDQLINLGFHKDNESTRHLVEQRAAALGFGSDMWQRLESAAMPLLEIRHEQTDSSAARDNHFKMPSSSDTDQAITLCRIRARAIRAAEKEFGKEELGRLLYQAVAPTFSRAYVVNSDLVDRLRLIEGGCK